MNPFLIRMLSRNRANTSIVMDERGGRTPRGFWIALAALLVVLAIGLAVDLLRGKPAPPTERALPATPDRTSR